MSATSYFDRSTYEVEDYSSFIQGVFGIPAIPTTIEQNLDTKNFIQEMRFTSSFDGPLQLVAGAYFSDLELIEAHPASVSTGIRDAFFEATGVDFGTDLIFEDFGTTEVEELAFFGELAWSITDKLEFTGGLRYFDTRVDVTNTSSGIAVGGETSLIGGQSESDINMKFLLEYSATEDLLAYASASEGYRIGGVNRAISQSDSLGCATDLSDLGLTADDVEQFQSDSVWNYEAGIKVSALDNAMRVNASAFYIDWSNIQQRVLLGCGFDFFGNSGAAELKGFEVEFLVTPALGWELGANFGFVDAEISESGPTSSLKEGDRVLQVPKWNISGFASYEFEVSDDHDGFARLDYRYVGNSLSANNGEPRIREGYQIVDFRAGLNFDQYEVSIFVENITNEIANLSDNRSIAAETPGRRRNVISRPRTIGLGIRYHF